MSCFDNYQLNVSLIKFDLNEEVDLKRRWRSLSKFVEKGKFVTKIFFQVMLNEVPNIFEK